MSTSGSLAHMPNAADAGYVRVNLAADNFRTDGFPWFSRAPAAMAAGAHPTAIRVPVVPAVWARRFCNSRKRLNSWSELSLSICVFAVEASAAYSGVAASGFTPAGWAADAVRAIRFSGRAPPPARHLTHGMG